MKINTRLFFPIFLFAFLQVGAQNPQPYFRNYTTEDGLPHFTVFQVFEDSKDYLWFATNLGACRFDGYQFQQFPAPDDMNYFAVLDFQEDDLGRVWFNSFRGNMYYFENDSIHAYWNNHIIDSIKPDWAEDFYIKGNGKKLYLELVNKGILELDSIGTFNIHKSKSPPSSLAFIVDNHSFFIKPKHEDPLIIQKERAIYKAGYNIPLEIYENGNRTFIDQIPKTNISSRYKFKKIKDDKFIYFAHSTLNIIEKGKVTWKKELLDDIGDIQLDEQGKIYFCLLGGKGLKQYDNLEAIKQDKYKNYLPNHEISWSHKDRQGGLWVTTLQRGIYYSPNPDRLVYNTTNGLSSEKVTALAAKNDNELFVGLSNGDVFHLNVSENKLEKLPKTDLRQSQIYHLSYDKKRETLWIGSRYLEKWQNGKMVTVFCRDDNGTKTNCMTRYFNLSNDKNRLIGANYNGFATLDLEVEKFIHTKFSTKFNERVNGILEDYEGNIWLGLKNGPHVWRDSTVIPENLPLTLKTRTTRIMQMKDSTLVFGTSPRGIVLWKGSHHEVIDIEDGLMSNEVDNMHLDKSDNIWVSSVQGLNRIKRHPNGNFSIRKYTKEHGLPSNEVNVMASTKDAIWVGTNKGLVQIPFKSVDTISSAPVIRSITINGKKNPAQQELILDFDENNLSLEFLSINFSQFGKTNYRYRLLPANTDWILTKSLVANFSALTDDQYIFELQSQNKEGEWSESKVFSFTILPPYWKRPWFILFCLIAAGFLIYAIYRYRVQQIKNKAAMERKIIELERSALRAQINPHFIFNALNSIQNFISSGDKLAANRYLTRFARLIRSALMHSRVTKIPLEDEVKTLNDYLELEQMRFAGEFDYAINVSEDIEMFDMTIPSMLIQPFVENAIIHGLSDSTKQGKIEIDFAKESEYLLVTIKDNGIGINQSLKQKNKSLHKSVGMTITKQRLEILASKKQGDFFKIEEMNSKNGEVLGTKVSLRIG